MKIDAILCLEDDGSRFYYGLVRDLERVLIGRARQCDIEIDRRGVSRVHGVIYWTDRGLVYENQGQHGTYIGREPIDGPHVLMPGEVLLIEGVQLSRLDLPEPPAVSLSARLWQGTLPIPSSDPAQRITAAMKGDADSAEDSRESETVDISVSLDALTAEKAAAERALDEMRRTLEDERRERDTLEVRVPPLEARVKVLMSENAELRLELDMLRSDPTIERARYVAALDEAERARRELRSDLHRRDLELKRNHAVLDARAKELEESREALAVAEYDLRKAREHIEQLEFLAKRLHASLEVRRHGGHIRPSSAAAAPSDDVDGAVRRLARSLLDLELDD